MSDVPPGGPATINGVVYQLLWSLLRTSTLRIDRVSRDAHDGELDSACIRLEPHGGGGDLRVEDSNRLVVEQVKTRSGVRTWSLRNVIEDVLPDLYKGVDLSIRNTCYRFITDGRMGRWPQVLRLFQSLARRPLNYAIPSRNLDDNAVVFRPSRPRLIPRQAKDVGSFWRKREYTERDLFAMIVDRLSHLEEKLGNAAGSRIDVERKVLHLLANFEILTGQTTRLLAEKIREALLARGVPREQIEEKRDSMMMDLARRAVEGDSLVYSTPFFRRHQIDTIPLDDWRSLVDRSVVFLHRVHQRLGYRQHDNIRTERDRRLIGAWLDRSPILAITGDCGQGKSWQLLALAQEVLQRGELCIVLRACGNAKADLEDAALLFCNRVWDKDQPMPLERIGRRICGDSTGIQRRWLTLCVDNVQDQDEAKKLAYWPWEDHGIRLAVTCPRDIAGVLAQEGDNRCQRVEVEDFSDLEVDLYLQNHLGSKRAGISKSVREILKRPLLCFLYCQLATESLTEPMSEYELYGRVWDRIKAHDPKYGRHDQAKMCALAMHTLRGSAYPWNVDQLQHVGVDADALSRLQRSGWLQEDSIGRFAVWHDRLLNWVVAVAFRRKLAEQGGCSNDVYAQLQALFTPTEPKSGISFAEVVLDVIWMLSRDYRQEADSIDALLGTLEEKSWSSTVWLYGHGLPGGETGCARAAVRRLVAAAERKADALFDPIIHFLSRSRTPTVLDEAVATLDHESWHVRRAMMLLFAKCPTRKALDRLWILHCEKQQETTAGDEDELSKTRWYIDSFGALKSCVRLHPEWLIEKIEVLQADTNPIHDLAYLVANINDGGAVWRRIKATLFRKVSEKKARSLATNLFVHEDSSAINWLTERVGRSDDMLGAVALRALIRLAPDIAVDVMHRVPPQELYFCRNWCFLPLVLKRPEGTLGEVLKLQVARPGDPDVASLFQGLEQFLTPVMVERLLVRLEDSIDKQDETARREAFCLLDVLSRANGIELLERFEAKRGTPLEVKLADWLLECGARRGMGSPLEPRLGIEVLERIGGEGYAQVVGSWLAADSQYGRMDGLERAIRCVNGCDVEALAKIVQSDCVWKSEVQGSSHNWEQQEALKSLAMLGRWRDVVSGVMKWTTKVPSGLPEQRVQDGIRLSDDEIAPALAELSGGSPSPGAIVTAGISGRVEVVEDVLRAVRATDVHSETAFACVLALDHLRVDSNEIRGVLIQHLRVPKHSYAAASALMNIGSEEALDALAEFVAERYDSSIVAYLGKHPAYCSIAAQSLWDELRKESHNAAAEGQIELLGMHPSREVRAWIRGIATGANERPQFDGQRSLAIRALARFDLETAFEVARWAVEQKEEPLRWQYPYIVRELDRKRGEECLLGAGLAEEESWRVGIAISRALQDHDASEVIVERLGAQSRGARRTACWLAAFQHESAVVDDMLTRHVDDPDRQVATAALYALRRRRENAIANRLLEAIRIEREMCRKLRMLELVMGTADPGEEGMSLPRWCLDVSDHLPHLVSRDLPFRIVRRQGKVAKEIEEYQASDE